MQMLKWPEDERVHFSSSPCWLAFFISYWLASANATVNSLCIDAAPHWLFTTMSAYVDYSLQKAHIYQIRFAPRDPCGTTQWLGVFIDLQHYSYCIILPLSSSLPCSHTHMGYRAGGSANPVQGELKIGHVREEAPSGYWRRCYSSQFVLLLFTAHDWIDNPIEEVSSHCCY